MPEARTSGLVNDEMKTKCSEKFLVSPAWTSLEEEAELQNKDYSALSLRYFSKIGTFALCMQSAFIAVCTDEPELYIYIPIPTNTHFETETPIPERQMQSITTIYPSPLVKIRMHSIHSFRSSIVIHPQSIFFLDEALQARGYKLAGSQTQPIQAQPIPTGLPPHNTKLEISFLACCCPSTDIPLLRAQHIPEPLRASIAPPPASTIRYVPSFFHALCCTSTRRIRRAG